MEIVGKLIYYLDRVRKVAVIEGNPFSVGSADYCQLKLPFNQPKVFFVINKKGIFFTISTIDDTIPLLVNGEKVQKVTILTNNSEIVYGNFKFIFKREKKEVVNLYGRNDLKEKIKNFKYKFKISLSFIVVGVGFLTILLLLFVVYKSYLDEIEASFYNDIKTDDLDQSIENARKFIKRFPGSRYTKEVKRLLKEWEDKKEKEKTLVLQHIGKSDHKTLHEILNKTNSNEIKSIILNDLLNSKLHSKETNDTINELFGTVKEFETIKESLSVSVAYKKFTKKLEEGSDKEKIIWSNLKNIYDTIINNKFRQSLNILSALKSIDSSVGCSYIKNLKFFYDDEKFLKILSKEEQGCETPQSYKFKIPSKIFNSGKVLSRTIKRYFKNFRKEINNFNLQNALKNLTIFAGLLTKAEIEEEKYLKLIDSIKALLETKFIFTIENCYKETGKNVSLKYIKDIVNVCLYLDKIDRDKLAIGIYKNSFIEKEQKLEIISFIFSLRKSDDFKIVRNKIIPASVYACEIVKAASTLNNFESALNELNNILKSEYIDRSNLKNCLSDVLEKKVEKFRREIEKQISLNKSYINISQARQALDQARKKALEKIFDEKFYPYDMATNNHGEKAQPEIDQLVNNVKEIWNKPANFLGEGVNKQIRTILNICNHIKKINEKMNFLTELVGENAICFVLNHNSGKSLKEYVMSEKEEKVLEWNKEARQFNEKTGMVGESEKEVLNHINEYRNMMGLPSLKFDKSLVEAAKHHAKYLAEGGAFSHYEEKDEFKDPLRRARYYGFQGSSVGENINMRGVIAGNKAIEVKAFEVFESWYKSSGHHRILLCKCCEFGGLGVATSSTSKFWVLVVGCK
ncbi:MAG: CAP domain-containing protein [Planctomycetota bacterium]